MGFNLYDVDSREDLKELQQNVNLSFDAYMCVKTDSSEFSNDIADISFSTFLNKIIKNFSILSESSINNCVANYVEKCKTENLSKNLVDKNASIFKKVLIEKFQNRLKKKKYNNLQLPSKFRINSTNIKLLNNLNEPYSEDGSVSLGNYLKAMFEEYSEMPKYKRELIFFSETINIIESAIKNNKGLRVSMINPITHEKALFLLKPYKIIQDSLLSKNYLVSISQTWNFNNSCWSDTKKISSIRISRISSITIQNSSTCFISNNDKNEIENNIKNKGAEFILGEIDNIKVFFDKQGLLLFKTIQYLKPKYYEKIDNNTYLFKCTKYQAKLYFSRFMGHAKILSPNNLNDEILKEYKEALIIGKN